MADMFFSLLDLIYRGAYLYFKNPAIPSAKSGRKYTKSFFFDKPKQKNIF